MKFIHDGVEFDLYKPEIEGWEFNEYRRIKCDERYFDSGRVGTWVGERPSALPRWIATKVEVEIPPTVEGWAFLEAYPRCPKIYEHYYVPQNEVVVTANITFEKHKYWIATKVEPTGREVVRCEIKNDCSGSLCYWRSVSAYVLDRAGNNPDFIGFEFEDGTVYASPIMYEDINRCLRYPVIKDIESGKVEVRHAKFALFFE